MDVTDVAVEGQIHRQLRDLAERAVSWLALREDGDAGVDGVVIELAERRTFQGAAGQSLLVRCERALPGDETPGELRLRLDANDDGAVIHAHAELVVSGRRKALRQVIGRLPDLPGSLLAVELARDPRLPKEEPSRLAVTIELPAGDAIEDLITRGLGALDALSDETASRDKKRRKR
jgi:hypothetical protein